MRLTPGGPFGGDGAGDGSLAATQLDDEVRHADELREAIFIVLEEFTDEGAGGHSPVRLGKGLHAEGIEALRHAGIVPEGTHEIGGQFMQLGGEIVVDEDAEALGALVPDGIELHGIARAFRHHARGGGQNGCGWGRIGHEGQFLR